MEKERSSALGRRRIGVLGGTFDPVHLGHLVIACEMQFELDLDLVLWVPAGDPPHKPDQVITPASHRVRMLELALADREGFVIDRTDLERAGPSYTADTVARIQANHPEDRMFFLMGADSLRDLHTWREPERILAVAELGVARRPDVEIDLEDAIERLPAILDRVTIVNVPLIGISSRDLRRRVAHGEPIAYQVPPDVERYIREHHLYARESSDAAPR
jgi:nicotinate-nucleotide adenylyltransferase